MAIKVTFDQEFIVNGKEFNSIAELPENIRQACEDAVADLSSTPAHASVVKTDIVFNGKHYTSIDAMPQDVRYAYQQVLKAAGLTELDDGIITGKRIHLNGNGNGASDLRLNVSPKAIVPSSRLSKGLRWTMAGGLLLILLIILNLLK